MATIKKKEIEKSPTEKIVVRLHEIDGAYFVNASNQSVVGGTIHDSRIGGELEFKSLEEAEVAFDQAVAGQS